MGDVKPFSPSPTVAPVLILDSLVFQWLVLLPWLWEQQPVYRKQAGCASHSLAGPGRRRKLALSAAEKAPACLGCVSIANPFFPPLPPSPDAGSSPPQPWPHGCLEAKLWFPEGLQDPWKLPGTRCG